MKTNNDKPLPLDVGRCSGRFDFDADNTRWCDHKETCARYLTFVKWDQGHVPHYRGIGVSMAIDNCTHKIEVLDETAHN